MVTYMRFILLIALICSSPAFAATYYISPTGNDTTGDGSSGTPWKSLTKAYTTGGGNTFILKDGSYDGTMFTFTGLPSGTEGNLTTIQAQNTDAAVITVDGRIPNVSYIKIEGLYFSGPVSYNPCADEEFRIDGTLSHSIITNNTFAHASLGSLAGNYNEISYNDIYPYNQVFGLEFAGIQLTGAEWPKSSVGNYIHHNNVYDSSEQTFGWDSYPQESVRGDISGVSGNVVTINPANAPPVISGTNAVGNHLLVLDGVGKGNYYMIAGQSGNDLTLDTTTYSTSGILNSHFIINSAFVDNIMEYNFIGATHPNYMNIAVSIFGNAYGNIFRHNTVDVPAGLGYMPGTVFSVPTGGDGGSACDPEDPGAFAADSGESITRQAFQEIQYTADPDERRMLARNSYHNNSFTIGQPIGTPRPSPYWFGSDEPPGILRVGNWHGAENLYGYTPFGVTFNDNTITPANTKVDINDRFNMEWCGNTAVNFDDGNVINPYTFSYSLAACPASPTTYHRIKGKRIKGKRVVIGR